MIQNKIFFNQKLIFFKVNEKSDTQTYDIIKFVRKQIPRHNLK